MRKRRNAARICAMALTAMALLFPTGAQACESRYGITIDVAEEKTGAACEMATVRIRDEGGTGYARIEIRLAGGAWLEVAGEHAQDVELCVPVTRNGLFVVRVTDPDGDYHCARRIVRCFDHSAPRVTARIDEDTLHIEAHDVRGEIAGICVGERLFVPAGDTLDVPLDALPSTVRTLAVRAYDDTGNVSDAAYVENPRYAQGIAVSFTRSARECAAP